MFKKLQRRNFVHLNIWRSLFHLAPSKFAFSSFTYHPIRLHTLSPQALFSLTADYLETLILSSEPSVTTGDFNVHVDDSNDPDATKLSDLLDSLGLCQHVTQSTHELGYTIDFIITRRSDSIIHGSINCADNVKSN